MLTEGVNGQGHLRTDCGALVHFEVDKCVFRRTPKRINGGVRVDDGGGRRPPMWVKTAADFLVTCIQSRSTDIVNFF